MNAERPRNRWPSNALSDGLHHRKRVIEPIEPDQHNLNLDRVLHAHDVLVSQRRQCPCVVASSASTRRAASYLRPCAAASSSTRRAASYLTVQGIPTLIGDDQAMYSDMETWQCEGQWSVRAGVRTALPAAINKQTGFI
jgi:hypothetical protein